MMLEGGRGTPELEARNSRVSRAVTPPPDHRPSVYAHLSSDKALVITSSTRVRQIKAASRAPPLASQCGGEWNCGIDCATPGVE